MVGYHTLCHKCGTTNVLNDKPTKLGTGWPRIRCRGCKAQVSVGLSRCLMCHSMVQRCGCVAIGAQKGTQTTLPWTKARFPSSGTCSSSHEAASGPRRRCGNGERSDDKRGKRGLEMSTHAELHGHDISSSADRDGHSHKRVTGWLSPSVQAAAVDPAAACESNGRSDETSIGGGCSVTDPLPDPLLAVSSAAGVVFAAGMP